VCISAFLLPAVAAILGTHRLARRFAILPMLTALATFVHAGFSGFRPTVMCDVLMLGHSGSGRRILAGRTGGKPSRQIVCRRLVDRAGGIDENTSARLPHPLLVACS